MPMTANFLESLCDIFEKKKCPRNVFREKNFRNVLGKMSEEEMSGLRKKKIGKISEKEISDTLKSS